MAAGLSRQPSLGFCMTVQRCDGAMVVSQRWFDQVNRSSTGGNSGETVYQRLFKHAQHVVSAVGVASGHAWHRRAGEAKVLLRYVTCRSKSSTACKKSLLPCASRRLDHPVDLTAGPTLVAHSTSRKCWSEGGLRITSHTPTYFLSTHIHTLVSE